MSDIAMRVDNLGKRYRIGARQKRANTMRERLGNLATSPFDYLRSTLRGPSEEEIIWALKDVSFEVKQGEVVGIIGRNGAGKTTLLKILSRITEPTEGRAIINGRVGSLLEVGTGFHPELTGRENIYLNGAILGMKRREIDRKFDEIVDFSGVEKFIDTPVKRFSSGMYVRLAFAVAAHLEPEILLVDEVLAVGDAAFQKKCLGKMGEVAQEGRTVLFVSHNMGSVMDLTKRSMLLESGEVISDGPSYQVVEEYLRQDSSSLSRDLSSVSRTAWGGHKPRWQITHVKILASEEGVISKRPIEVELKYSSHEDLEDVVVGIGIANLFGTRLISCRSDDSGMTFTCRKGESGIVRVQIEHPYLAQGKYILQVGAATGSLYTLDYVGDALGFEVQGNPEDALALDRSNLAVRLPSRWQLVNQRRSSI